MLRVYHLKTAGKVCDSPSWLARASIWQIWDQHALLRCNNATLRGPVPARRALEDAPQGSPPLLSHPPWRWQRPLAFSR
jgi:hypothetical protein